MTFLSLARNRWSADLGSKEKEKERKGDGDVDDDGGDDVNGGGEGGLLPLAAQLPGASRIPSLCSAPHCLA